jgi:hypothetical protein
MEEIWQQYQVTSCLLEGVVLEYRTGEQTKPTCLRMELIRMLVTHLKGINSCGGLRAMRFKILLFIFAAIFVSDCHAQSGPYSGCGHSTVADAWGSEFASQAEAFLAELQQIVKTDDKARFAALVRYPIQVSVGDEESGVSTPSAFIRRYGSIVTPVLKQTILAQDPKCLFANGQGVMIGHGQLWFQKEGKTMRIITITLDSPVSGK